MYGLEVGLIHALLMALTIAALQPEEHFRGEALELATWLSDSSPCPQAGLLLYVDHVYGTLEAESIWFGGLPDTLLTGYVLDWRVMDEGPTAWRTPLAILFGREISGYGDPGLAAGEVMEAVSRLRWESGYPSGEPAPPESTLARGGGTGTDLTLLLCAGLRSLGLPARPVLLWTRGAMPGLRCAAQVWDGVGWAPLVPDDVEREDIAAALIPRRRRPEAAPVPPGTPESLLAAAQLPPVILNVTSRFTETGTLITAPVTDTAREGWSCSIAMEMPDTTVHMAHLAPDPFSPETLALGTGEYVIALYHSDGRQGRGWVSPVITVARDSVSHLDLSQALYAIAPPPEGGTENAETE